MERQVPHFCALFTELDGTFASMTARALHAVGANKLALLPGGRLSTCQRVAASRAEKACRMQVILAPNLKKLAFNGRLALGADLARHEQPCSFVLLFFGLSDHSLLLRLGPGI